MFINGDGCKKFTKEKLATHDFLTELKSFRTVLYTSTINKDDSLKLSYALLYMAQSAQLQQNAP